MEIPALITVRTSSTRLPKKCLLPFGDGNVLEHVIRRAKHFRLSPIICTTNESADDVLEQIAFKEDVPCFRGSVTHKLKRWLDCCNAFALTSFHSVDADDPFFDGELVKKSMQILIKGFDVVAPTVSSSNGGASVGYSLTKDIISRACEITESDDTEMMWYYLEKVPGLKKTTLPEESDHSIRVRLTLDYEEDYWLARSVQRILGSLAPRREIDRLFRRNPDLYRLNWFRNSEWRSRQMAKRI